MSGFWGIHIFSKSTPKAHLWPHTHLANASIVPACGLFAKVRSSVQEDEKWSDKCKRCLAIEAKAK